MEERRERERDRDYMSTGGGQRRDALRQMGCVGVSAWCSARLPWQQAQMTPLGAAVTRASDITLRGTGVCGAVCVEHQTGYVLRLTV